MTYQISENCIACGKCLPSCPTGAITKTENGQFAINPDLCNDCVGAYGVAQCMSVCPTNSACTPLLSSVIQSAQAATANYWEQWFTTYQRLTSRLQAKRETQYWHSWFDTYSQKLQRLITTH